MTAREAIRLARDLYLGSEGTADELLAYVLYVATVYGVAHRAVLS